MPSLGKTQVLQCGSPDSLRSRLERRKSLVLLFAHPDSLGKPAACSLVKLLRVWLFIPLAFFKDAQMVNFSCCWSPSTSLQACVEVPLCSQEEMPIFQSYLNKTLDFAFFFFLDLIVLGFF